MKLREVMNSNIKSVGPATTIQEAAKLMKTDQVGLLPIVGPGDALMGVVTDRDLAIRVLAEGMAPKAHVREAMTHQVQTLGEEADLQEALDLMESKKIGRVLVTDDRGKLTGVISLSDAIILCKGDERTAKVSKALATRTTAGKRLEQYASLI